MSRRATPLLVEDIWEAIEKIQRYTEIEWRKIIGLRNRIVHDYFNIDVEIVWEIIQKDLPNLKSKLSLIRT